MNRLWMLLFLLGCAAPVEPQVTNYNLSFLKDVDTIYVDVTDRQVTAGFGQIDTVSTVKGFPFFTGIIMGISGWYFLHQ